MIHQIHDVFGLALPAVLIDTSLDRFEITFFHGEWLNAPYATRNNSPVGTDHTLKAELVAEEVGQNVTIECHGYVLIGLSGGNAVIGHNDTHVVLNGGDKGGEVIVKVVTRVYLTLARFEVWV